MTPTEQKTKLKLALKLLTELQSDFKLTKAIENVKHTLQIVEFNNCPISPLSASKSIKIKKA